MFHNPGLKWGRAPRKRKSGRADLEVVGGVRKAGLAVDEREFDVADGARALLGDMEEGLPLEFLALLVVIMIGYGMAFHLIERRRLFAEDIGRKSASGVR